MSSSDRIEKQLELKAPLARVWRAISDHEQFGTWFRVKLEGPFVPGQSTFGRLTQPGYEQLRMELKVTALEPPRYLAYQWHPYAIDLKTDYSNEPPTLVEFRLEETKGGTLVKISESGFDRLPAARRDEAFRMNEGGWAAQLVNLEAHVRAAT